MLRRHSHFFVSCLLLLLGAAAAIWAYHSEGQAIQGLVSGREKTQLALNQWRPILLASLGFLPFVAWLLFLCGDRIDRYLGSLFAKCLFSSLTVLFSIWMIVDLNDKLSDFNDTNSPLSIALQYYFSQLPAILVLLLPYSLLVSLLYLLGKLSRSNEIVSIFQCGRSLPRLALPFAITAALCCYASFVFNFHWAPEAGIYRKAILKGSSIQDNGRAGADKITFNTEDSKRIWQVGFLPVDYFTGGQLEQVRVESFAKPGELLQVIEAPRATWQPKSGQWIFHQATIVHFTPQGPVYLPKQDTFAVSDFTESPGKLLNPSLEPALRGIPSLKERLLNPTTSPDERLQLHTHQFMRWANSLSGLVVVLIALPLGVVFSRQGSAPGVAVAIFISAAMLFCGQVIPSFGEAGYVPPLLAAWGTNLVFTFIAIYLIQRRLHGRSIYATLRDWLDRTS